MSWIEVWRKKGLSVPDTPTLTDLMSLNGYDTGAGYAEFEAMLSFAARCADRLGIKPGIDLLEIGCGGGAWLLHHYQAGANVSGIDISHGHLKVAAAFMPEGRFACSDAAELPFADASFDIVFAGACFLYLSDEAAAHSAISEIARVLRSGGRGAITDLPDASTRADAEKVRRGALGVEEYERLYAGLEHQYFDRKRIATFAESLELRTEIATQEIAGYGNSPYRFNLWFDKP